MACSVQNLPPLRSSRSRLRRGGGLPRSLLQLPAASVTSTDPSSADRAESGRICPQSDRHRIIGATSVWLPFRPAQYDVVICLGVVQHTQNPEATIANLYGQSEAREIGGCLTVVGARSPPHAGSGDMVLRPFLQAVAAGRRASLSHGH